MVSIRQNVYPDLLPDFRNLGVIARVLVAVNVVALAVSVAATPNLVQALEHFLQSTIVIEPLTLASLVMLFALSPWLARLPYWLGCVAVLAVVAALGVTLHMAALAS